jgi:Pyruvate/2-oxoacid:ferredoxin oxidoreductase delta subunit
MGHASGEKIYHKLGEKISGLETKAPWNEAFYSVLKELYSTDEADLIIKMPYDLSDFETVTKVTGVEEAKLRNILNGLCSKGLVIDLWITDKYYYMPSPIIIGIFEFTMMRTRGELNSKKWAELLHHYIDGDFFMENFGNGETTSLMRSLPHEETIKDAEFVEILDYEKASALVEEADNLAIGLCSCRHKQHHIGEKTCEVPLEKCSSLGYSADFFVRNGLSRKVSKSEMQDNIAQSKEMGLVLNADNTKRGVRYICHCCKCCCIALSGISRFGYPNTIVTSTFIAETDEDTCKGCGKCSRACAIDAIEMVPIENPSTKKKKNPRINTSVCLGCGVCALKCDNGAVKLVKRGQRVLHPEDTFERVILQCLDRGTLQNQMFGDPQSVSHKFMRGFMGGFFRLSPVKRALMSDTLRSSFLSFMKKGIKIQGKSYVLEL